MACVRSGRAEVISGYLFARFSAEAVDNSKDVSTGIRDPRRGMDGFDHDKPCNDRLPANSFQINDVLPPPAASLLQNGLIDLPDATSSLQGPSVSATDVSVPASFSTHVNAGFSCAHLFTEENALSSLELEGKQYWSNQSHLLNLPSTHPHSSPLVSTANSDLPPKQSAGSGADIVLLYMQMLMEEEIDDKFDAYPESSALLAVEKPFYDILGEKLPTSPAQPPLNSCHVSESHDGSLSDKHANSNSSSSGNAANNSSWLCDEPAEHSLPRTHPIPVDDSSESSFSSTNSFGNTTDGVEESFQSLLAAPDLLTKNQPAWQFLTGIEGAPKFVPNKDRLAIGFEFDDFCCTGEPSKERKLVEVKEEDKVKVHPVHPLRGRKNRHGGDSDLEEGRSSKQSAIFADTPRTEMVDMILLCSGEICTESGYDLPAKLQGVSCKVSRSTYSKGSNSGKGRKKHSRKDVVDLSTLLIHCAQAVASDDHRNANELLKQIRQHSSPHGDANERLAHYFADGLQARLAGTGSHVYHALSTERTSLTDVLKAYQLFTTACPFRKISHFFSTQSILNVAENATRLHIIDFGIYYGFQWPCFLQRLSSRIGRPPKVRMTGIDLPVPGFRPAELIDETGRRLADYARSFGVPFEFRSIAATKWDAIRPEDFGICKDEVLIVNCLYRFKSLMDETVTVDNPRDRVLNTIRKINPNVFIHGVINGTYNAPFFVTRFREALFHYSSVFDMIQTNVLHEDESRQRIEKLLFGREVLNIIACEGTERLERPETYKQWTVRILRAGFMQRPLNRDIVKKSKDKVKTCYHKDFIVDEDNQWLLQGWKGRIIYALSTWKANTS